MDHRQLVEIYFVSGRENHVIGLDFLAVGEGDVHRSVRALDPGDGTAFVKSHLADDAISQPVGGPSLRVHDHRVVLFRLRQTVEEIRQMLEGPVDPSGSDAVVRSLHPFNQRTFAEPVPIKPSDGPTRYEIDDGSRFLEQSPKLDGTLPATDHNDPFSPESVDVTVIA